MSSASPDFFATSAQVIATFVLAFAVESHYMRSKPSRSLVQHFVAALLLLAVIGMGACLAALSGRGTPGEFTSALIGLAAAVVLVLIPPFDQLFDESFKNGPRTALLDSGAILGAAFIFCGLVVGIYKFVV